MFAHPILIICFKYKCMHWHRASRKPLPRSQEQCLHPRNLFAAAQYARNRYDSPGCTVTLTVIWASERHVVSNWQKLDCATACSANNKDNIEALHCWNLWGESTSDQDFPKKGPLWRMLFHVMTSSYCYESPGWIGNAGVFFHRTNLVLSHYIVNVYNTHIEYIKNTSLVFISRVDMLSFHIFTFHIYMFCMTIIFIYIYTYIYIHVF